MNTRNPKDSRITADNPLCGSTKRASTADQRKRSKAEHTWVRWCVLWPSEIWPEYYETRSDALADSRRFVGRSKVCRIEIAAGMPDPLRKRRK